MKKKKKREDRKSESSRLWVEDARDSIYRGQSNEPLGVLITWPRCNARGLE